MPIPVAAPNSEAQKHTRATARSGRGSGGVASNFLQASTSGAPTSATGTRLIIQTLKAAPTASEAIESAKNQAARPRRVRSRAQASPSASALRATSAWTIHLPAIEPPVIPSMRPARSASEAGIAAAP
jgi:hypothetical protein